MMKKWGSVKRGSEANRRRREKERGEMTLGGLEEFEARQRERLEQERAEASPARTQLRPHTLAVRSWNATQLRPRTLALRACYRARARPNSDRARSLCARAMVALQ